MNKKTLKLQHSNLYGELQGQPFSIGKNHCQEFAKMVGTIQNGPGMKSSFSLRGSGLNSASVPSLCDLEQVCPSFLPLFKYIQRSLIQ